ncbi:kinase-like protein [Obba rivulosa]|uniref:Kinase-like protein n=1 Tax=Obba rivulosa TaxID=1052685 RepID=A0A8E2AUH5_9APHY|nr:kinase-like protein [Obba rivulosa]
MTSHRMSTFASEAGIVSDGVYNYDVHEVIGQSSTSTVYRATCRRGRLRNRAVAIKIIHARDADGVEPEHLASSTALHQALHHPCIVSLLSSFATPSGNYRVLEYCPGGTLSDFLRTRTPTVLTEDELRGVVKSLVDALVYLRKEHVLHRDINPGNILLAHDNRIKLSGFGLAIGLPSLSSMTSPFYGSANYAAPELVAQLPYGYAADIWSSGCLIVTCLTGVVAFEALKIDEIFHNITRGAYSLPNDVSFEIKDLISGLLQLEPTHRIPLHRIPSHPFFNPALPVTPLVPLVSHRMQTLHPAPPSLKSGLPRYPQSLSKAAGLSNRRSPVLVGKFAPRAHSVNSGLSSRLRTETIIRQNLQQELQERPSGFLARRVASAPETRPLETSPIPTGLISALPTPALTEDLDSVFSIGSVTPTVANHAPGRENDLDLCHPLLSRPASSALGGHPTRLNSMPDLAKKDPTKSDTSKISRAVSPLAERNASATQSLSPAVFAALIDRSRPELFSTAYLTPQAHKISQGQLVILPSMSALVDFREGERRKGGKGNEVLVISADGQKVEIHAPHLSTPCCLAEPLATYRYGELPADYRSRYRDASHIADKIRRSIPKLTLHDPDMRSTLMANIPYGDIEILYPPPNSRKPPGLPHSQYIRLRYLRRRQTIEVARYVPARSAENQTQGEWYKKIFSSSDDKLLAEEDWNKLDSEERKGLKYLGRFLRVCGAVEALDDLELASDADIRTGSGTTTLGADPVAYGRLDGRARLGKLLNKLENGTPDTCQSALKHAGKENEAAPAAPSRTGATVLPSLNLAPRPSKFASGTSRQVSETTASRPASRSHDDTPTPTRNRSISACSSAPRTGSGAPEAKYLPAVGWCLRSRSGEDETYRVMFPDGASLEVNMSRDIAHLTEESGGITEIALHEDTDIPIATRMKAFHRFVRLFSDNDERT